MKIYTSDNRFFEILGIIATVAYGVHGHDILKQLNVIVLLVWIVGFFGLLMAPVRHFCGIVTIHISPETIQKKYLQWIKIWSVPYEQAYVGHCIWFGVYCVVFSKVQLEGKNEWEIRKIIWKNQAIYYPLIPEMDQDFPELMARDQLRMRTKEQYNQMSNS